LYYVSKQIDLPYSERALYSYHLLSGLWLWCCCVWEPLYFSSTRTLNYGQFQVPVLLSCKSSGEKKLCVAGYYLHCSKAIPRLSLSKYALKSCMHTQ